MNILNTSRTIFIFLCLAHTLAAQPQLRYEEFGSTEWVARTQPISQGNGVFLSPDEKVLVTSTQPAIVHAFDTESGVKLWGYNPSMSSWTGDNFISCLSGITFASTDSLEYIVYAVIIKDNLSLDPQTYVVALSMLGEELWVSSALDGVNAGSPVVSLDGTFVFLTHNSASQSVGHFSILDGLTGDLFHSESSLWSPFAPLGIHHAPAEGYYDGGQENRNDILVWSFRPMPNETSVAAGAMFGFQFPIGFSGQQEVGLFRLGGDDREFRAISRPVFANDGRSLYIGTTKSMYRCWVGKVGFNRHRFSRAKTSSIGFTRGNPANQAVWAPLALSQVEEELYLFGGTAANEFIRLNTNFSNDLMISTTSLVKTEARISPDNLYVYYVELEGHLHQASTANLADKWIYRFRESVEGEFSLTKDGTVIFIADVTGLIHALRVANHPTESPTPSIQPTSSPSKMVSQTPQPSAGKLDPICQDILANGGPVERGRLSSDAVSLLSYRSSSFGLCCYVYALFFFVVSY